LLEEAIAQLRRTLPLGNPQQQSWVWFEIGRCYLRLEDATRAEEAFEKSGDYAGSLAQLAKLRMRSGRVADAVAPLNSLSQAAPRATETFLLNARAAEALGDAEFAQQCRDRAEYNDQVMPNDPVTGIIHPVQVSHGAAKLLAEGKALVDAKRWDEAASVLSAIVAERPEPDALLLLAGAELERRRPERTIRLLSGQFQRRGAMPVEMLLLGDAYAAAGQADKAASWWEATARARSSPEVHERLAKHYEQSGRAVDARRQRALAQEAAGIAQLRHANPKGAKASLESAVAIDPSLGNSWFYLGECRRLLGDKAAAREAYQAALERAPNHGRAHAALALVQE
jgi:tetratricopeptide (TPR) repeat protein